MEFPLTIEWQPVRIRGYLLDIERGFIERVRALGFEIADESDRAANLFGLKMPLNIDIEVLRNRLTLRKIHVAVRGSAVRVSPHVYNDEGDLEQLADLLDEVMHE